MFGQDSAVPLQVREPLDVLLGEAISPVAVLEDCLDDLDSAGTVSLAVICPIPRVFRIPCRGCEHPEGHVDGDG